MSRWNNYRWEASVKTQLEVGPFLAPGSKATVHARIGDSGPGAEVKNVTVGQDGSVKIDGLEPWGTYFLVGKDEAGNPASVRFDAAGEATDDLAEQVRLRSEAVQSIKGEFGAVNAGYSNDTADARDADVPDHNWEKSKGEREPEPRAKYVDVKGPQRVGADIGTAYPKDPDEVVPHPSLDQVKDNVPLRSGADEGYAYVKDPKEQVPGKRYEDETGPQRTGADTGTAVPKPKTASKRKQAGAKDSSVSKARGATAAVAGTDKAKGKGRASAQAPVKKSDAKKAR